MIYTRNCQHRRTRTVNNRTKSVVLPIALCAESKLPALTSKESIKCIKKNKKINQL